MRPIKFRGVDLKTGEFVYGDFVHYVPMSSFNGIVDEFGVVHDIVPNSQAQLVGFDKKDGDEIYEGDIIANSAHNGLTPCGEPLSAHLSPCLVDKHRQQYFSGDLIRESI